MSEERRKILLCCTREELLPDSAIAGAKDMPCAGCATIVSVSPSSQKMIEEDPSFEPHCPQCVLGLAEADGDPQWMPLTKEQAQEVLMHRIFGGGFAN